MNLKEVVKDWEGELILVGLLIVSLLVDAVYNPAAIVALFG